ncbi:MAG: YeaC family protein [Pseudomonadota bacterium]
MAGPRTLEEILATMNPEILMNMKTAVETGRWANGGRLTPEQTELCLQAIIAYEERHLPEHERTGYIDRTGLGTKKPAADHSTAADEPQPLNIRGTDGDHQ